MAAVRKEIDPDFRELWDFCQEYPNEVSLETWAKCNARCTFCPYPTMERIGDKMSDEMIDSVVDQIAAWRRPMFFSPFKVNEPFLDPRTIPLCEKVNRLAPLVGIRLFTNGSTLIPEKIEQIGKLKNIYHLWISLNEYREDEYEKLMGLKFSITTKRIDHLHKVYFPHRVVLSCVGQPNEEFKQYCRERWPRFQSVALKKDAWIDFTTAQVTEVPDKACLRWFELNITASGKVARCCMDGEARYGIGDIRENTLYDIYNSHDWKRLRESLMSRRDSGTICQTCTY